MNETKTLELEVQPVEHKPNVFEKDITEHIEVSGAHKAIMLIAGLLGLIYILNPSAGFIEILPDNLPIVGNLDEAGATMLVLYAIKFFRDLNRTPEETGK